MALPAAIAPGQFHPEVRAHYEALPYPPRDPQQERHGLGLTWLDRLDYLNDRFWNGAHSFDDLRVLIAGDGTGDASVFLAEQLVDTKAEIIALDLSEASQSIAKARAAARGLSNIRYVHASLLDLPSLGLGHFDYINSSGVLHHLPAPDAGLAALAGALAPNGVLGIMVYGRIARTGVYQAQSLLRLLTRHQPEMSDRLNMARSLLKNMPKTHWFAHNTAPFLHDIQHYGDSGIYDLLLHAQDCAYTASEAIDWVEKAALHFAEFSPLGSSEAQYYAPERYTQDATLRAALAGLNRRERADAAELLAGTMACHFFYATRNPDLSAIPATDLSAIASFPCSSPLHQGGIAPIIALIEQTPLGHDVHFGIEQYRTDCRFIRGTYSAALLAAIDSAKSAQQIIDQIAASDHISPGSVAYRALTAEYATLVQSWRDAALLVLRHDAGRAIPSLNQLHANAQSRMPTTS